VRTIVIINQKGGCGKTTSSINLAAGFASRGCRTLLVDMDPQSHCAAGLGVPEEKLDQTIYDALRADPQSTLNRERLVWHVCKDLDLIPSHMMLAGLESSRGGLMGQPDKELRLRSVIDRISRLRPEADESGQVRLLRRETALDKLAGRRRKAIDPEPETQGAAIAALQ